MYLRTFLAVIAITILLAACATEEKVSLQSSEVEIAPHPSATKLCQEHPELRICKNANNP